MQCVWRGSAATEESKSDAATFSTRTAFFSGYRSGTLAPCAVQKSPAPAKLLYNCFFFFVCVKFVHSFFICLVLKSTFHEVRPPQLGYK